ncbi:MAG: hypothetical protein BMS9Abin02_1801 [Anaerolineae bacterium]|nr:MAG: hypothetical protein BMS9Abin02_1799 [Anaerolineae bacterium]GMQ79235.1 MAG: hypothetical protein BMS9Abin02_1801 [Anaerolineae bacterium]
MTRQFKKLAHSLYECKYHIVFCPKYRYKILVDELAKYVTQQIYRLFDQKDGCSDRTECIRGSCAGSGIDSAQI